MPRIHFLNVNDGDCSIIQHSSGRNTVIDVSAAKVPAESISMSAVLEFSTVNQRQQSKVAAVSGNFNRSKYPDDPIEYMQRRGIESVFRFISTHPDMDHLDGIRSFFHEFPPQNFWDTANTKKLAKFGNGYDANDWSFYKSLRDSNPQTNPRRLTLYSGARGAYFNDDGLGNSGGDGLSVLAPTPQLVIAANIAQDWNDCSYVILYRSSGKRILFCGDSHDKTWNHILTHWSKQVANIDVLIAPHHGRHSDRDFDFLDMVNPKLTLFGNAPSEHLAYDQWNSRDLLFITNNQAGAIVLETIGENLNVYVAHEPFARSFVAGFGHETFYSADIGGWYLGQLT